MSELEELNQKLARLDTTVPNAARIYDYLLGKKDNYQYDRDAELACRQNRAFLRRAIRYLSGEAGISQFVDIVSGLPTADNTHDIAQEIRPDTRVAYVDYDPVVVRRGLRFFDSMELADPGLVNISRWRANEPPEMRQLIYGGVAWKPVPADASPATGTGRRR